MRILITGSGGLVGRALRPRLAAAGHEVLRLVRRPPLLPDERQWNPAGAGLAPDALDGVGAVVHLAGAGIADRRWSPARKAEIRSSRVLGTALLARDMARAAEPPPVLISASAIGYYGERGDHEVTEADAVGAGFLAEVCRDWEGATEAARDADVRVVNLRFGLILSADGGALKRMLLPFRLGLGGNMGSGRQWMSWATLDDVLGVIQRGLDDDQLTGPVNVVTPHPVTNADFTRALGRVLKRPTIAPMPAFAARLMFGELADALLLSSARVLPKVLEQRGHAFQQPELEPALRGLLT